jgi:multidrug efflux pump subunit AcrA (membrane-fusion protein)
MAMAAMVMQKQEQILTTQGFANPLVSVGQYRNTLGKFIEAAGYKDSMEFFKEIPPELDQQLSQPQPQQPMPNPAMDALMAQTQAQIEVDRAKALNDIEIAKAKAQASIQLEREKAAANLELKTAEFQAEAQLKAAQIGAKISGDVRIPG